MATLHSTSRPPSFDLISLATPPEQLNEKHSTFYQLPGGPSRQPTTRPTPQAQAVTYTSAPTTKPTRLATNPSRISYTPLPQAYDPSSFPGNQSTSRSLHNTTVRPPRTLRALRVLKPWIPMILYAVTTFAFIVAVALYRTELFTLLDELSLWLQSEDNYGHAVMFGLIFLTTIPPIPLYSTLIILSGYTFGAWIGALISYFSALLGAFVVFVASRALLRESIGEWLDSYVRIKRVVRAIEKRPKLLFLIRFAPYPYNVLNCLLAASPTLSLHTYTVCTALSLFKVIVHTSIGASIHSFKDYHEAHQESGEESSITLTQIWTVIGIALCAVILVYLYRVANRAVDEELDEELFSARNSEERQSFLAADDLESGFATPSDRQMVEVPFSPNLLVSPSCRASFDVSRAPSLSRVPSSQWS